MIQHKHSWGRLPSTNLNNVRLHRLALHAATQVPGGQQAQGPEAAHRNGQAAACTTCACVCLAHTQLLGSQLVLPQR